jgi:hypothetical protein
MSTPISITAWAKKFRNGLRSTMLRYLEAQHTQWQAWGQHQ